MGRDDGVRYFTEEGFNHHLFSRGETDAGGYSNRELVLTEPSEGNLGSLGSGVLGPGHHTLPAR